MAGTYERGLPLPPHATGPVARAPAPYSVSVIACAYNEAQILPQFLRAVLSQSGGSFAVRELICVASGCTDGSSEILLEAHHRDSRVRPIIEPSRQGKAAALSRGLDAARGDLLLVTNADTLPTPGAFESMIRPFRDAGVGLVCSRNIPVNSGPGITARLGGLLWEFHDVASRAVPKAAGSFAFRPTILSLPSDIEDDDTFLGILLGRRGIRSVYAGESTFLLRVPENAREFLGQRLRINRQILGLYGRTGMLSSTWRPGVLVRSWSGFVRKNWRQLPLIAVLTVAELAVRMTAILSRASSPRPLRAWAPATTTKGAIELSVPE